MNKETLQKILKNHQLWLDGEGGEKANLVGADLQGANLENANLRRADLREADLRWADLIGADLRRADLRGANLRWAYLRKADLRWAYLIGADLRRADLEGVDLRRADLSGADLENAKLPDFQLPEGELTVYKKAERRIVTLRIPADAKRTACLTSNKCRAERAFVVDVEGGKPVKSSIRTEFERITYTKGEWVTSPNGYCDDIRLECTRGIHFFMKREEAVNFLL